MRTLDSKQPYEAYYIAFDFSNVIASSSIVSATITVVDSSGEDKTSTITTAESQVLTATQVNVWIKGGTDGETYKITCRIITNSVPAEKYELDAELPVVEE